MSEIITLEELKQHCIKTIEDCERIKRIPNIIIIDDRRSQEHKLILQLIEEHEQRQSTDAVSREAVLKSLCELGYGDEENGAEAEYMYALRCVADKVKALPPVTPEKGEWIPLKYRPLTEEERNQYGNEYDEFIDCEMPDENEEVLLTLADGTVSTDIYCEAEDCTHYFENYDFNHIKAWMHKPEGYKEEQNT